MSICYGLRNLLAMDEGGCGCILRVVAFLFSFGGDGGANLGEGGRDVGRRVVEVGAGMADGDADERDASPISSEAVQRRGWYFSVFLASLSWRPRYRQKPI